LTGDVIRRRSTKSPDARKFVRSDVLSLWKGCSAVDGAILRFDGNSSSDDAHAVTLYSTFLTLDPLCSTLHLSDDRDSKTKPAPENAEANIPIITKRISNKHHKKGVNQQSQTKESVQTLKRELRVLERKVIEGKENLIQAEKELLLAQQNNRNKCAVTRAKAAAEQSRNQYRSIKRQKQGLEERICLLKSASVTPQLPDDGWMGRLWLHFDDQ
jgi:hypothetical protein